MQSAQAIRQVQEEMTLHLEYMKLFDIKNEDLVAEAESQGTNEYPKCYDQC